MRINVCVGAVVHQKGAWIERTCYQLLKDRTPKLFQGLLQLEGIISHNFDNAW